MKNSILGKARWLRDVALATSKNNGARVAQEWLKYAAMFVMLLTVGVGNAWGANATITLTQSALGITNTSYSSTEATKTVDGVTFGWKYLIMSSSNIQSQASNGEIYNTTAFPGKIISVAVTHSGTARSSTIYFGTSSKPTENNSDFSGTATINAPTGTDCTYFRIKRGSNAAYWTQIVITYEEASSCTDPSTLLSISSSNTATLGTNKTLTTSGGNGSTVTWSVANGTGSATVSGSTLTPTGAGTVTVTATQEDYNGKCGKTVTQTITISKAAATITLSEAGATSSVSGTHYGGDSYTLPTTTSATCGSKVLVGWSTVTVAETNTKPTSYYYEKGATVTLAAGSNTFYAVFATASGGAATWDKVTTLAGITAGTYVIINNSKYLPNTTTSSAPTQGTAPTITGTQITGTVTDEMKWYFTSTGTANQFYIQNEDDDYLYETSANNGLRVGSTSDKWTFAANTLPAFSLQGANNSRYCATYSAGSDWRSYTTANAANYGDGGKVYLYKLTGGTTYSAYSTTCVASHTVSSAVDPAGKATVTLGATSVAEGSTTTATYSNVTNGYEFVNWTISGSGATLSSNTATTTTITMGTANVTVTANLQCVTPTFTASPASKTDYLTTDNNPAPLGYTASAAGASLTQQWQVSTDNSNWSNIGGATSATYTPDVSTAGTKYYRVVVTNSAAGCSSATATSNVATITSTAPSGYCISIWNSSNNGIQSGFNNGGSGSHYTLSFTVPGKDGSSNWPMYWVGENNASQSYSTNATLADMPLYANSSTAKLGLAEGATGTLHIWDDNKASGSNLWVKFQPSGYGLRWGGAGDWNQAANTKPFTVDANDANVYWTDIVTLDGTNNTSWNYYVGLQTASGYVYSGVDDENSDQRGISRTRSVTAMKVSNGTAGQWKATYLNSEPTGSKGKFRIWDNNTDDYGHNLCCHWVPFYEASYNVNGGGAISPAVVNVGPVCCEGTALERQVTMPAAPTYAHHDFGGWKSSADNSINNAGATVSLTQNTTFTAQWTNTSYNITATLTNVTSSTSFPVAYTYTGSAANVTYTFSGASGYRLPTTVSVSGCTSTWDPSTGVLVLTGTIESDVTITITAVRAHTITWSANGVTTTSVVDDGNTLVLPAVDPTSCDDGDTDTYTTFIGWYTTAAGTNSAPTASIASCGTKATADHVPTGNETYYAVWGDGALASGETKEVTLDFSSNTNWGFPADNASGETSSTEIDYTSGDYTVTIAGDGSNKYYFNSNQLLIGKTNAYIKLPAFAFAVTKIVATTPSGNVSGKVTWNVFVGSTAVSEELTGCTAGGTFEIDDDYQDIGTIYTIKVTNGNNLQIKALEIYTEASGATGFISSCCGSNVVVSVTPESSSLALNIDGQATTTISVDTLVGGKPGKYYPPEVTPAGAGVDFVSSYKTKAYTTTFTATAAGTYTVKADFTETAAGCPKYGSATITVAANPLVLTSVDALTVNGVCEDSGTPQTFTLNSRYLPNASKTLTITAATTSTSGGAYKVSLDGSTYSTSVNVTGGVDSKATQTVYVRYEGAADEVNASLAGSVTISNGVTSASVTLSGACTCGTYVKLTPANATSTHILAPNGQWTRAQGVINIRANYLSSAAANVNIKLTSSNDKFKFTTGTTSGSATFESGKIVTATDNDWDGTVYIVYTPTSYNASESTTITAKVVTFGGTTEHASTTTTVYGRSFPETFVLAVNTGSSWVAVPADMIPPYGGSGNECSTGVGTHDPYPITVNNDANPTSASNVPARAIYKGASRNTPTHAPWTVQMESNSQTGYYLWGSKQNTTIANQNYATGERQKWFAESSDLVTFNFHLDDTIRTANARLGYSGSTIGQYTSNASSYKYDFRILPVSGDPCAYIINPVMTLDAYDGTTATVSIPYDGTTNYEISKDNKETWTDITGTIDCKKLTFSLPLATYKGTNIWLRADGTVCQGDATSVSSLHIPAPVITDPGAQHLYGVINVATSESFAVTGTDMYGTISVTSSNPAITASYEAGNVTVNMASTAVADDYVTTLTLSSVGAANVTVDVTITIRDLAEMTFRIDELSGGKICHNSLTYDDKFYVYLNGGSAVYQANDGSSLVDATYKVGSAVFIRDLSTNGDDWNTGFNNYSVASGIAQFSIPTTSLVSGHTYRISYYNSLANEGAGFFDSNGLGFADAHVDFVYSLDCTAPTAMMPCITSPTSIVAHWDDFTCEAPNTLQLNLFKHNDTELVNADFPTTTISTYSQAGNNAWGCGKTNADQNGVLATNTNSGYTFYTSATSNAFASPKLSTIDASTELQVTFTTKNFASANRTVQLYVVAGNNYPSTSHQKTIYIDDVRTSNKTFSTTSNQLETWNVKLSGLAANDRIVFAASTAAGSYGLKSVTISTVAREYVTGYDHKNVDGTSQEVTGLTANTTYYTTMSCGSKESAEVAFHTWPSSGSSYVKFYEDAGHTTEIEAGDKIVVLGGQTTHVYMVGQKVPGCEVVPTVSSGYGLVDHTTYDPATGALGGYIDLTLTNPAVTSGTLTITDGTGTTYTRPIKSSDCPTDFETLALAASAITKNSATANWNSSANFEGVTEGTLYLYRDGVVDAEYITNEGFETGDLTGWDFLNIGALYSCDAYEVKSSNAHSGTHALYASKEGSGYAGFGYTTVIYGNPVTLPAGTYEMTSWVKVPVYSGYSDKHSYFKQGLAGCTLIGSTNETCYALSPDYTSIQSNNTYVQITDVFVLENPIKALPFVGHRADVGYTFHPFYLDDVSLKRISAPNAEEPDKVFPIADLSAASSQALGTLSGNTQYTYLLKNANGCPSNSITFKTLQADGPVIEADDIEISAPAGSSATGVITVQVWDATAEISVSKGVATGSDQITLGNSTVAQEGGTIRVLFTPNTAPGSTGTCPVILNTRGLAEPVTVNINWTVTAGEDTDKPIVEVTEISNSELKIEHNVEADSVRIVMNREKTADEIELNVGDEIFFSKYYEAYSHKKLWAIFNPTNDTISLAGMEVWRSSSKYDGWHSNVMDLSEMGNIKPGWICPDEEIVVYTTNQVGTCEQNAVGIDVMSTWWQEGTSSDLPLSFSGDDALMLVRKTDAVTIARNNALPTTSAKTGAAISWPEPYSNARGDWYMLDIIGGRTDGGSPSGKNVQGAWHWYNSKTGEYEDGDDKGWVGYGQDMSGASDYNTSSEHPGYLLSTNRCLLVRRKNVTSGANAINSNIENMVTLNTEWQGSHVPTEGDQDAVSCSNFSFVGSYDYAGYYNAWTEVGDYEVGADRNPDGSFTVEMDVPEFYCKTIHIEVMSIDTINGVLSENVHASEDYKVPIVVDANKLTTADLFSFGGDTCANCDVVIRDEAKLSHVSGGVSQFRNMTVYPGASFDNSAKQGFLLDGLLMEAKNDEVGYAIINNNGSTIAAGKVVHVKRIDDQYWYPFSLPYDCDISAIRQQNGKTMGEYWEDWGIKYYDGAARQSEGSSAYPGTSSKYWKQMPVSGTLKANEAYIIGLFTTEWDGQFKSVYFPPKTTKEYTEAGDDAKTTDVYNWVDGLANDKRHHGWNFVGSPYISMFGSSVDGHGLNNKTNLILGMVNELTGEYEDLDYVYVSIPNGGNSKTYKQAKASATTIEPFKGYFVQTVDPTNGTDNTLNLTYQKADRTLSAAPARKATAQKQRVEVDLTVNGEGMSDIAGVVVDDCFTPEYEIAGDLTKMYAAAAKPQLYFLDASNEKMAYIALPDANAENVAMELYAPKAGKYTISLNEGSSRTKGAESIELLYNGNVVANLLIEDYTIEAAKGTNTGYSVRIRRAAQVTTSTETINGEHVTVVCNNGQISICNVPADAEVLVFDMVGKLMRQGKADGEHVVNVDAPQQGVYNIVIQSAEGNAAVKTFVR